MRSLQNWLSFIGVFAAVAAGGWPSDAFAQCSDRVCPDRQFQYAVKFVCGHFVVPPTQPPRSGNEAGQYKTAINIHNPSNELVEYRYKTAQAGSAVTDGPISRWHYGTTGPDGAQVFVCDQHIDSTPMPDGFFVIESRLALDVTAVYTAAPNATAGVSSIHVDRIAGRTVPNLCRQNTIIDLSSPTNWTVTPPGVNAVQVPPATVGGWDQNRTWMSYDANGGTGVGGNRTYRLQFCSCSSQGGTLTGDVKSDDGATGVMTFLSPPIFPPYVGGGNFGPTMLTQQFTPSSFTAGGTGVIQITVDNNGGGPTGVSFHGALHLNYGHLGRCQ